MNLERSHNQIALRLGYNRLLNDNRITINVVYENPNGPRITLLFPEGVTECFNASENPEVVSNRFYCTEKDVVKILEVVHGAYQDSTLMHF